MIEDVTNSPKDWDQFWNNSEEITPVESIDKDGNVHCFIDNQEVDCDTWKSIKPYRTIHNYIQ
tara:strand:+ start:969 stop:1157 length:189 start_codon:yes stop_codon:yes gene_type:complete